jgi:hypothetical protein
MTGTTLTLGKDSTDEEVAAVLPWIKSYAQAWLDDPGAPVAPTPEDATATIFARAIVFLSKRVPNG